MVAQTLHLSSICQKPLQKRVLSGVSGRAWTSSVRPGGAAAHLPDMDNNPASTGARVEHLLTVQELSDYLGIPLSRRCTTGGSTSADRRP
jgi:hypothetical protein